PLRGGATSAIEPANVANPRLVSVIVPCHNGARFLADAIESALAQTHPAIETIVVDDGSVDDTPAILERYADRVRVLHQQNRRALVDEIGGFEESLRGCEEWDLFLRLSRRGMRWASIDATLGDYRVHPAQSHGQTRMMLASAIHVLERFFSDPELPPVLRAVEGRAFQAAYLRGAAECYRAGLAADADRAFHAAAKARPEFLGEAASL